MIAYRILTFALVFCLHHGYFLFGPVQFAPFIFGIFALFHHAVAVSGKKQTHTKKLILWSCIRSVSVCGMLICWTSSLCVQFCSYDCVFTCFRHENRLYLKTCTGLLANFLLRLIVINVRVRALTSFSNQFVIRQVSQTHYTCRMHALQWNSVSFYNPTLEPLSTFPIISCEPKRLFYQSSTNFNPIHSFKKHILCIRKVK